MNSTVAVMERKPLEPLDLEQTKGSMALYQQGLQGLLDSSDWQTFQAKDGEQQFLKRSGWRKIALWFGLNIESRSIDIERDSTGRPIRARVIARAIAANGRYADGEGGCSTSEQYFSKPEHDLPATASTRAVNRAISNLVGLGAVSAEEISTEETTNGSPFGPAADEQLAREAAQAVQKVLPSIDGFEFVRLLSRTFDEQLPEVAARTLKGLEWFVSQPAAAGNENSKDKE